MLRKTIGVIFALALAVGGGYLLYLQLFHSLVIKGHYLMAGAVFSAAGIAWLWIDHIGPLFGYESEQRREAQREERSDRDGR